MRVLFLSGLIVLTDQVTKLLVKGVSIPALGLEWRGMDYGSTIPIIGDFFRLTYIENPGMAFGIDLGGKLFFSLVSIVASVGILVYLYRAREANLGFRIALALILGGAVGNLVDRALYGILFQGAPLFYGRVIDFFDVDFFDITIGSYHLYRWPVFNIADACVTVGVVLLLLFHRRVVTEDNRSTAPAAPSPSATGSPSHADRMS